jgi:hypothetical protein
MCGCILQDDQILFLHICTDVIWIHKIKFMTSWPIIVVGWGYDLLEVMIKGKGYGNSFRVE